MTARTRYFVIASLLVLTVGIGTGLVAYYVGLPTVLRHEGPEELQFIPRSAAVVAYANVHEVMGSGLRQKMRQVGPLHENGQREFEDATGINIETDIDRVVACLDPQDAGNAPHSGLVLARGRFNEVKIEALMRDHGARVDDYKGKRLIVGTVTPRNENFVLAFIAPGLAAIGNPQLVRAAIDLQPGGQSVTSNDEVMRLVRSLDSANAWAVGRFDALRSAANLPAAVTEQLPVMTWFSLSGQINSGVSGVLRAEARDEEAARNLRDVVRGFVSLAKLQGGANPPLQATMQSLEVGGNGRTVSLSFSVSGDALETLGALRQPHALLPGH